MAKTKFITTQIIAVLVLISIAFANGLSEQSGSSAPGLVTPIKPILPPDLSNFPNMFIKDGNFNAVIVVGDKAPASDAVAQSNLVQFFGWYTGKSLVGSTKLSSEIESLNQNIISIGSACHNNVSWEIMGYPKQCDRWLEPGKAMILLYSYKDYVYMVIAGYSDKGTRDAVNVLINYDKATLSGSNMLIDINESKPEINETHKEEDGTLVDIEEEKEKSISELTERIANKSKEISKNVTSPTINKTKEKISSEQKEQRKEISIIKIIIEWISSLFK